MTRVVPKNSRISQHLGREGLEIIILPRRQFFALAFLCFWLVAWTAGGVAAGNSLLEDISRGDPSQIFLMAWLGGWAIGWLFVAKQITWSFFGNERIVISNRELLHQRRFPFFKRTRAYSTAAISRLRWEKSQSKASRGSYLKGWVQFHYGLKVIEVALDTDEAEGEFIVNEIRRFANIKEK